MTISEEGYSVRKYMAAVVLGSHNSITPGYFAFNGGARGIYLAVIAPPGTK